MTRRISRILGRSKFLALTAMLLALLASTAGAQTLAAEGRVTLSLRSETLRTFAALLPSKCVISKGVDPNTPISIEANNEPLYQVMSKALSPRGLAFKKAADGFEIVPQPRVSFAVNEQPLSVVGSVLFGNAPFVFSNGADVNTTVSANIVDLPLDAALTTVTSAMGYFWRYDGTTYEIYRDKEETFAIDFPMISQSFDVATSRSSSQSGFSSSTSTGGGTGGVQGSVSSTTGQASAKGGATSVDSIAASIKEMISKDGRITVDKEMGLVWVRDHADVVDRIDRFMKDINERLQKVVHIQGIITEVTLNNESVAGVNWDVVVQDLAASIRTANTISNPAMVLNFKWDHGKQQAYLAALHSYGDVKVVSKPSISVANGAVGSLTMGDTVSYVAQAYSSNQASSSVTSSLIVQPIQVGLSLYVVPRVISDDRAIIYISPDLTSLAEIRTIQNQGLTVEAPKLTQKQTQTIVTVKNGEKILISGIMAETKSDTDQGVPILKDIPYLGSLFRYKTDVKKKTEFALMLEVTW